MTTAIEFLRRVKLDEVASKLESDGFEVHRNELFEGSTFDLLARKGERAIAYEAVAKGSLQSQLDRIDKLGKLALKHGIDEFRLIVVPPPRETKVVLEGIETTLLELVSAEIRKLDESLYQTMVPTEVHQIEFDQVEVKHQSLRVSGQAVLRSIIGIEEGKIGDQEGWNLDSPFGFDVSLKPDLQVDKVHRLELDVDRIRSYLD